MEIKNEVWPFLTANLDASKIIKVNMKLYQLLKTRVGTTHN